MNRRVRELKAYPMDRLNRAKEELRQKRIKIYDFGTGDPKEPTDERIRRALIEAVPEVSQYPTVKGSELV